MTTLCPWISRPSRKTKERSENIFLLNIFAKSKIVKTQSDIFFVRLERGCISPVKKTSWISPVRRTSCGSCGVSSFFVSFSGSLGFSFSFCFSFPLPSSPTPSIVALQHRTQLVKIHGISCSCVLCRKRCGVTSASFPPASNKRPTLVSLRRPWDTRRRYPSHSSGSSGWDGGLWTSVFFERDAIVVVGESSVSQKYVLRSALLCLLWLACLGASYILN